MIVFTAHALERMKPRRISKDEVLSCMEGPDSVSKLNDVYRAVKREDDKVLVVIYRKSNDESIIITAYRSSKKGKYL
jgi:serine/threonine-protein kinase RIO1